MYFNYLGPLSALKAYEEVYKSVVWMMEKNIWRFNPMRTASIDRL